MWRIQLKPISTDTQQPSPHKPEWQEVAITHFDFDGREYVRDHQNQNPSIVIIHTHLNLNIILCIQGYVWET